MSKEEVNFLLCKVACAIATTLQIKKSYLLDYTVNLDDKIMGSDLKLNIGKFTTRMIKVARNFSIISLGGLDERIDVFSL